MANFNTGFINQLKLDGKSVNTISTYETRLTFLFENIKEFDFENVTNYLLTIDTPSTRNLVITVVKQYAKYLNAHCGMEITWHELIKKNKLPKKHIKNKVVESEIIEAVVKSPDVKDLDVSVKKKAIVSLFVNTGLRVTELCELKLKNIEIFKDKDDDEMGEIMIFGKGAKERNVFFNAETCGIIKAYLSERGKLCEDDYLFVDTRGNQYKRRNMGKLINSVFKDYRHVTPHMLRHTFASQMVKQGENIRVIQELLGHENIATTQIYTHIDNEDKRAAAKRLYRKQA